jgi:hypothetical protein
MKRTTDESGVILSWFLRVGLLLLVIGVVGFDVGSMVVNNVTLSTAAEDVAVAVSITVSESTSTTFPDQQIYDLAVAVVKDEAAGVAGAKVLRKGTKVDEAGVVHIRLRRRADTLVTRLIGPLKKYTVATVSGQAGTN